MDVFHVKHIHRPLNAPAMLDPAKRAKPGRRGRCVLEDHEAISSRREAHGSTVKGRTGRFIVIEPSIPNAGNCYLIELVTFHLVAFFAIVCLPILPGAPINFKHEASFL